MTTARSVDGSLRPSRIPVADAVLFEVSGSGESEETVARLTISGASREFCGRKAGSIRTVTLTVVTAPSARSPSAQETFSCPE